MSQFPLRTTDPDVVAPEPLVPARHPAGRDESRRSPSPAATSRGKRVLDVVGAFVLLLVLSPVLAVLALAVGMTSRGPVIFRQERIGMHGRPFTVLKFRTMRVGAEAEKPLLRRRHRAVGPLFKLVDDPRVTRVGRHLRRHSLDELPQLVNVLRGEMSLVGPRPALPEEVAGYAEGVRRRLDVRPGLTGLWQVSGRSDLDWEQSVGLDLRYVEQASMFMDLRILVLTVPAVLFGRGAY